MRLFTRVLRVLEVVIQKRDVGPLHGQIGKAAFAVNNIDVTEILPRWGSE